MLQRTAFVSKPREVKCSVCPTWFVQQRMGQEVCGPACARRVPVLLRKVERAEKARTKAAIEALKPLSYWTKQAQTAVNGWIRARDAGLPCISCQNPSPAQFQAGHYLSTGARPELRFDEDNIHAQCSQCNEHLSGNLVRYRPALIAKIGAGAVARLEGPHPPRRYRADELQAIRDHYRARLRAMLKEKP